MALRAYCSKGTCAFVLLCLVKDITEIIVKFSLTPDSWESVQGNIMIVK